jgi:dTDP-4-dehydrorhamnose reductase
LKTVKILITGANGLLGQYLLKALKGRQVTVMATGKGPCRLGSLISEGMAYHEMDITDSMQVNTLIREFSPDLVIHGAAMTQADYCETHKQDCWNINVTATSILLDASRMIGSFFIFISTDFVFDGKMGPYKENDHPGPVNYYGNSKLAAEKSVSESGLPNAIIRTVLVYGNTIDGTRNNIITWVKTELENNRSIRVVNDQFRTPTYAGDLANGILMLAFKKATGIWHISGSEILTPYEMAIRVADTLHLNKSLIEKVDASLFSQDAERPLRTGFIIDKARKELDFSPISFEEGIRKMTVNEN